MLLMNFGLRTFDRGNCLAKFCAYKVLIFREENKFINFSKMVKAVDFI